MEIDLAFNWVLRSSLLASVLVGIVLAIKKIMDNKLVAKWHYAIWFLVFLRLLVPCDIPSSFSIFNVTNYLQDVITSYSNIDSISLGTNFPSQNGDIYSPGKGELLSLGNAINSSENRFFMKDLLALIWLIGVLGLVIYIIVLNIKLNLKIKRQPQLEDEKINLILEKCKAKLGVKKTIPVIASSTVITPSIFGILSPKLLLPPDMVKTINDENLKYVILHELSHIKRKDIAINWIVTLLNIIHWFNPVIWYARFRMRQDCEIACDAMVLSHLKSEEHRNYGYTILNLAASSKFQWLHGTSSFGGSKGYIKRRISMIKKYKNNSYGWSLAAILIILVVALVGLTSSKAPIAKGTDAGKVYTELNDGKELVFEGEGVYWKAKIIEKFYEHFWEDKNGKTQYENIVNNEVVLKYKGNDYDNVRITSYEYKDDIGSGGGGKGNFHLNENGYINLSESGGKNINIRREDETFKMTIEWNGKKETFSIKSLNNKNTDAVAEKAPDYTANEQRQTCGAVPYLVDQQHKNKT